MLDETPHFIEIARTARSADQALLHHECSNESVRPLYRQYLCIRRSVHPQRCCRSVYCHRARSVQCSQSSSTPNEWILNRMRMPNARILITKVSSIPSCNRLSVTSLM